MSKNIHSYTRIITISMMYYIYFSINSETILVSNITLLKYHKNHQDNISFFQFHDIDRKYDVYFIEFSIAAKPILW